MSVPKYYALYKPLLEAIRDGNTHPLKSIKTQVAAALQLCEEDLAERLPSGTQTVFDNRLGWARTYLKKAGLLRSPQKAHFVITEAGKELLASGVPITNEVLSSRYPGFLEFTTRKQIAASEQASALTEAKTPSVLTETETPQEVFERMHLTINQQLADELLTEIMNQTPAFFEQLVVDLMKHMEYGEGFVTKISGDGGVDGIIHEDKLGFNLIYIQAKRWDPDKTIVKPEIQKFYGAMMGPPRVEKGLFITTAKFSQGAREYASAQHIILVDGQKLTELMIEYNLGVSVQKTYTISSIDKNYFTDL